MEYMLLVGVAFWSTLVFIGVRRTFEQGESPICEKARDLKRAVPGLLLAIGIAGPLLAVILVAIEINRIQRMVGEIGGHGRGSAQGWVDGTEVVTRPEPKHFVLK